MADRYDTTGNLEAEFEAGSDNKVLVNKLGVNSASVMDDIELDLLVQLYDVIPDIVEQDQQINTADIRDWHRRWLANIYTWAGQNRTVNMAKGDFQFASVNQISRLMNDLDNKILAKHTPCCYLNDDALIEAIAIVHIELILIHPFREGNGRLSRLLANIMAMQAGKPELDFSYWDNNKSDYFTAIQAGLDDYEPMKKIVKQVLRDTQNQFDHSASP